MIEVKNICKTYRPKKGVPVKALDDVSLKFDDTGMVFILGKSGSGKSTLLNVLGGLDSYDSGEFVIQGKSSQDFTQSDFDSYRNTLIGFIFQEYNILNDFSVGANIALAMQLQGKKATNEALNKILDDVDLTGYANRKPNELSGGQKQRVAIARALIKEPRIIMADEPTGALDSNTGKQVFDTLKKLSKDKLVIIVSHDREFAEFYGDRVIELADGKIISDISKYLAPGVEKSEGVKVIDDKILHIKQGYKLTAKDLDLINSYLDKSPVDTLISIDERANNSFKQIAMIDDSGNKQSFTDTSNVQTMTADEYEGERLKLIKSRMPYANSLKMGASSLKHKKIRLIFTIFLSVVAFALFGLADTFACYDKNIATVNSIIDGKITSAVFEKSQLRGGSDWHVVVKSNDDDIAKIKTATGIDSKGVVEFMGSINEYTAQVGQMPIYYSGYISGVTAFNDAEIKDFGCTVKGKMPTAINEVAITNWHFEHFQAYGYRTRNSNISYEARELNSVEELLKKELIITYNDIDFKIVGVVDTGFNKNGEYNNFKENTQMNMSAWQFQSTIRRGMDALMFISEDCMRSIVDGNRNNYDGVGRKLDGDGYSHSIGDLRGYLRTDLRYIAKLNDVKGNFDLTNNVTSLKDDEILLSSKVLIDKLYDLAYNGDGINIELPQEYRTLRSIVYEYTDEDNHMGSFTRYTYEKDTLRDMYNSYQNGGLISEFLIRENFEITDQMIELADAYYQEVQYQYDNTDPEQVRLAVINYFATFPDQMPKELKDSITTKIYKYMVDIALNIDILSNESVWMVSNYQNWYSNNNSIDRTLNIAGFFIDVDGENSKLVVSSDTLYDSTIDNSVEAGYYEFLIGKMPTDRASIEKIVAFSQETGDTKYSLRNSVTDTLDDFNYTIEMMSKIFIYIGIGFAVFAALMMMNFISTSISYKKREIGILRAVGARGSDVFGIFFNESAIIALINFVLAALATMGACMGLNSVIRNQLGFPITILSLGFRQVALIFAVSLLAAFVASLLPVMKIARKRPIDAIQNR